jgi:hypothetical protein
VREGGPTPRGAARGPRGVWGRREASVHVAGAVLGPVTALVLLGGADTALLWRTAAVTLALTLVLAALLRAAALARSEWRREAPAASDYRRVVLRFAVALALVVAATS